MRLIVNADDYGLTMGVSKGIIEGIKSGIVTDTTAMANMPAFEEAIEYAFEQGITEMGIHLTLSCGKPLTNAPSLVDESGNFSKKVYKEGTYNIQEVENEFRAQISKFLNSGMKLNHIDGHHHIFAIVPASLMIALKLAKEYNIPMRCPFDRDLPLYKMNDVNCPDHMVMDFYQENVTIDHLESTILKCKEVGLDVLEVMCHPAHIDDELKSISSYVKERQTELEILTCERVKKFISDNNIEMISFSSL